MRNSIKSASWRKDGIVRASAAQQFGHAPDWSRRAAEYEVPLAIRRSVGCLVRNRRHVGNPSLSGVELFCRMPRRHRRASAWFKTSKCMPRAGHSHSNIACWIARDYATVTSTSGRRVRKRRRSHHATAAAVISVPNMLSFRTEPPAVMNSDFPRCSMPEPPILESHAARRL